MIATLQSLDSTMFRALKSSGEGVLIKRDIVDPYQKFDLKKASRNVQKCCERVSREQSQSTWQNIFVKGKDYLENPALIIDAEATYSFESGSS
jgi:hypothetical protein